jgi:nitroreductase
MLELKNLLNRKTVKNFLPEKIDPRILENAVRVAWRAPTSLNSKPVILLDISSHRNEGWIANQPAVKTAPHLFLFAMSLEAGESNARKFLAGRYGSEIDDERVEAMIRKIVTNREEWARQQVYLTAGYFATTLEAARISGCFIAGFDKSEATEKLNLPESYQAELIFAAGLANPKNDGSVETDFVRDFNNFYFLEKN